jgi:hypothetical protein
MYRELAIDEACDEEGRRWADVAALVMGGIHKKNEHQFATKDLAILP